MNSFRASIGSKKNTKPAASLLGAKQPSGTVADTLESVAVVRETTRTTDHRDDDRHRLGDETADLLFRGKTYTADIINLSGGGAMVRGDFVPMLWEKVALTLGENGRIECAVRWIRGDRFGLEFAHETQVHGDAGKRNAMLLQVLRRSFPDIGGVVPPEREPADFAAPEPPSDEGRGDLRHPLIWTGMVHYNHDSTPVRLRNISSAGALVESPRSFPIGSELFLDLDEAGSLFATVRWVKGDQVGLSFAEPYDIAELAKARPAVTPQRWSQPDYLREDHGDGSPWSQGWNRLSVDDLKASLEGFLRH